MTYPIVARDAATGMLGVAGVRHADNSNKRGELITATGAVTGWAGRLA